MRRAGNAIPAKHWRATSVILGIIAVGILLSERLLLLQLQQIPEKSQQFAIHLRRNKSLSFCLMKKGTIEMRNCLSASEGI